MDKHRKTGGLSAGCIQSSLAGIKRLKGRYDMEPTTPSTQSSLHISEEVIATIADEAIRELDGVYSLSNLPMKVGFFTTPAAAKPVKITYSGDVAQIDIGIVVNLNDRLKDICERVQAAIKDSVQNMTGITVSKVNVFVSGVHIEQEQ